MIAVKICGMRDPANIVEIGEFSPKYMGFICWPGSKRYVGETLDSFDLKAALGTTKPVGVFVNQSIEEIRSWCMKLGIKVVQLHGEEDSTLCRLVKDIPGVDEVWKAISVKDVYPAAEVFHYEEVADRILFDTKTELRGGSGESFPWHLLDSYSSAKPIVLSGGLGIKNVDALLDRCRQWPHLSILDFNSTLESTFAVKEREKVASLMRQLATLQVGQD